MNDTQILDAVRNALRAFAVDNTPASPALLGQEADWIDMQRGHGRQQQPLMEDEYGHARPYPLVYETTAVIENHGHFPGQRTHRTTVLSARQYWQCKHYPSAIDNYFSRDKCEHGCDTTELRWNYSGCKPAIS